MPKNAGVKLVALSDVAMDYNRYVATHFTNHLYMQSSYIDLYDHYTPYVCTDENQTFFLPVFIDKKWGVIPRISMPLLYKYVSLPIGIHDGNIVAQIVRCIQQYSMIGHIHIQESPAPHHHNPYVSAGRQASRHQNHILDLSLSYNIIIQGYNRNLKRNLKEAREKCPLPQIMTDISSNLTFLTRHDVTGQLKKNAAFMSTFISALCTRNQGFFYSIVNDRNEIISNTFFVIQGDTLYFLLCASNEEGKKSKALFYILDLVINKYAQRLSWLDFTGSSIPDIARRNTAFGAQTLMYSRFAWGVTDYLRANCR